jgi:hypothetical protein
MKAWISSPAKLCLTLHKLVLHHAQQLPAGNIFDIRSVVVNL